jgi:hypothetical protein
MGSWSRERVLREFLHSRTRGVRPIFGGVNGRRILEQVIRTQAATSRPGFDVHRVLRNLVAEARALTGADAAVIDVRGHGRMASDGRRADAGCSLVVPLPPTAPAPGALTVYSGNGRRFTAADRDVLDLLARLIGSTLMRAAMDSTRRPHALPR